MAYKGPGRIVNIEQLHPKVQHLIKEAADVRKLAYCPYSNFAVGAALLTEDEKVYTGCNVESAVFTPSICAERTAVCKAVSEGYRKFAKVAVVAHQDDSFTSPCGVCRQVLTEFASNDMDVYLSKPESSDVLMVKLSELLPLAFDGSDIREKLSK